MQLDNSSLRSVVQILTCRNRMLVLFSVHQFGIYPDNLQAKDVLCDTIDNYIRDRILLADQVIQETAGSKIKDGDVVLTYARSVRACFPPCRCLPLLAGHRWLRRSYCMPGYLGNGFLSSSSTRDPCWKVRPLFIGRVRALTCALCPRQGVATISHDCIDTVYISSLTIPSIRLTAHDDVVCRRALSPCKRRSFFAGWNSDDCYDGPIEEYSRCSVL